jgi:cell division septation protein DedD
MNNLQRGIYQPLADKVPIYDLADEDPEEERSRAPLLVVIALVVLAAFAGVVWLAYNQGVERGRQGASLVITAPEGPVRISPPEAVPAPFTGLNVYNEPVPPEQEAKASALAPKAAPPPAAAPEIRLSQALPPAVPATPAPAPARPAAPAASAPAPAAAAPAPAAAAPRPAAVTPPPASAPAPAQVAQAAQLPARPPQPAAPPAPAAAAAGASRAASGAAVLQLGAFESQELANGAWASFRSRYEALSPLSPDIQRADLGAKGIVYRLRAGPFADRAAAVDACTQLKQAGGNCFVAAP